MVSPEDLYVMDLDALHEDLYRMGNATSPNFNEERLFIDCRVIDRNGIKVVLAGGKRLLGFQLHHRGHETKRQECVENEERERVAARCRSGEGLDGRRALHDGA